MNRAAVQTGPVVVGIGASAGGLEALREMLASASTPTNMCFVIVQHLDPNHESMLAQLLDRHTELDVLQSVGGEKIEPDKVFIIPPGRGLVIRDGLLELTDFAQPRGLRRPIDDFFVSLALDQQQNAACVILSGTGADGTTGLRAVKEGGGICVVQEPNTARYDGMPLSAVGTGLVDFVKPPVAIMDCLRAFFSRRGQDAHEEAEVVADHVDEMCRVLRNAIGHDFSGYKRSTLVRRVERRMHVLGIDTGRSYLNRIRTDASECEALFRDLLINVTRFFRDPDFFEVLRIRAIEPIVRNRKDDEDIRVWVPGCSSGEEAYTIAMLFAEACREAERPFHVQVFATDIDEQMLQVARDGSYPVSMLGDIPEPLRERYTVPHADRFSVSGQIRDAVRFSSHSVVKDPPFSQLDLISCRNLLIYFDDRLQQSVMPIFHYSLKPGGFLFLGPSETIGRFDNFFHLIDQPARLFERAPGAPRYPIDLPGGRRASPPRRDKNEDAGFKNALADDTVAVRKLVDRYLPPSMVLDADGGIVAAYGRLGLYFDFPVTRAGGVSAMNLARPGLRDVIGPLLRKARDARKRAVARDVEVVSEFGRQAVDVFCDPLADGTALLVVSGAAAFRRMEEDDSVELEASGDGVEELEEELRLTRHRLRSAVEELETANEELRSSNEEMMSMNEELQSTNEELSTVNDELKGKVDQLGAANSDLRNFFESTSLAVIVLDEKLAVRSYTEAARAVFPFQPGDRGRPLADVASRLDDRTYLDDARAVLAGETVPPRRIGEGREGRTYSLRTRPYRLAGGEIDGVTLILSDITDELSMERALASERERLNLAVKAGRIGVWEYFPDSGRAVLDETEQELLAAGPDTPFDEVMERILPEDRQTVIDRITQAVENGSDFEASFRIRMRDGDIRWLKGLGRMVPGSEPRRMVGVSLDVSAEYSLAETRELMIREMNHRVKNLFAIISGMIGAGARQHSDVGDFARGMRERIAALGRAHSLASPAGHQEAIELGDVIRAAIEPYRDHARIAITGPSVHVAREALSPLAMIFHEWATNATKYGALASPPGSLDVSWQPQGAGIVITWRESFAGRGNQPGPAGFGTRLVETSTRQLRASLDRSLGSTHLEMKLTLSEGFDGNG
ncbi:PAS domain-containing protein [Mesorhizobium sp. RP14(2022)]|uniref:Blue-light-activated histidine kinase n=1 Tax=Mesorhizobium liriopis TaxID=2953882 RepID=A0ABT1C2T2_9HYPH|nr:PAS domain-containing protein [Mesorhizobium liriopis]